ncbi:MAG TPA: deoxyribose-phosphate aldolase [Solibacterales bacterium]|nr:deoxyribose-phosphate aldolase [Bryobacterales bacterium]
MIPPQPAEGPPPLATYESLAKLIDHSLVRPELTEAQVEEGCRLARAYGVASVTVRPSDVDLAVQWTKGSDVRVGSVAGFPHGSTTTPAKLFEIRDLLRRGAREIDMVLNIGKMVSRQFQYVEMEIYQAAQACHGEGAILKVVFENAFLGEDMKVIACKICNRSEVDFVKTATAYAEGGYTIEDLKLMRRFCVPEVGVKAAGGVRTLEAALEVYNVGCTRIGATQTAHILDEWKAHLARLAAETQKIGE